VLTSVVDRSGKGDPELVRSTFVDVERRLRAAGFRIAWPVSAEIVRADIMGATRSSEGLHELSISIWALRSGMLDGLIAHEAGHMIRTEAGHPSHDAKVYGEIGNQLRVPSESVPVLREAFNHVQDIYADDIAFSVGIADRAYEFFASWIDGHVKDSDSAGWKDIGKSVSNGFALGNLVRHRLLTADDPLWSRARAFDQSVGLASVDGFAAFFADLPPDPTVSEFVGQVKRLAFLIQESARKRIL
jgi:hypothetical protein